MCKENVTYFLLLSILLVSWFTCQYFCVFAWRALKTRTNTPKYGLIFHSTFIGRAATKNKGRISRYLANKCSIASRIDCFAGMDLKCRYLLVLIDSNIHLTNDLWEKIFTWCTFLKHRMFILSITKFAILIHFLVNCNKLDG